MSNPTADAIEASRPTTAELIAHFERSKELWKSFPESDERTEDENRITATIAALERVQQLETQLHHAGTLLGELKNTDFRNPCAADKAAAAYAHISFALKGAKP